jgi:two-component system, NtrC family, sensor kinase
MRLIAQNIEGRLEREITGRKEAERLLEAKSLELYEKNLQLADYSKQLEEALEHVSAIMASTPDVIVTCDSGLVVENVNDCSRDILGYAPEELRGARLDTIIPALSLCCSVNMHSQGPGVPALTARTKSGETIEVELREKTALIRNRALHVYTIRDVTERNRTQRLNDAIVRQLHESRRLEAIGALASGIAHEINTPIQFIGDNIAFLKKALKDIHKSHLQYEKLRRLCARDGVHGAEVARIDRFNASIDLPFLIREILVALAETGEGVALVRDIVLMMRDFAHPGTGQPEMADIHTIVRNVLTICRNRWKTVAAVETNLPEALPQIACHPSQLQQVLINLLINAVEAIEDAGQSDGRIRISARVRAGRMVIHVSDSGPGIPEALREKIFDPFFTTKTVGRGTGQGLALAKDIVVNHHRGSLRLGEQPGFTTSFVIELPVGGPGETGPIAPAAAEGPP